MDRVYFHLNVDFLNKKLVSDKKMFQCHNSKLCIPTDWLCDGVSNCGENDRSDEDQEIHNCSTIRLEKQKLHYDMREQQLMFKSLFPFGETLCKMGYDRCSFFICMVENDGILECPHKGKYI